MPLRIQVDDELQPARRLPRHFRVGALQMLFSIPAGRTGKSGFPGHFFPDFPSGTLKKPPVAVLSQIDWQIGVYEDKLRRFRFPVRIRLFQPIFFFCPCSLLRLRLPLQKSLLSVSKYKMRITCASGYFTFSSATTRACSSEPVSSAAGPFWLAAQLLRRMLWYSSRTSGRLWPFCPGSHSKTAGFSSSAAQGRSAPPRSF